MHEQQLNWYQAFRTCDNNHTITRDKLEARVLAGPAGVTRGGVGSLARLYRGDEHDRRAQAEVDCRALRKIEKAVAGIMTAIEDGLYPPSMKACMEDLERQKAEIAERLPQAPADIPDLHPTLPTSTGFASSVSPAHSTTRRAEGKRRKRCVPSSARSC